ncbi:MAG: Hsp20/alpha crystallin family protein [Ruminococcaceae bacterium]|nr:Hsp20/alpha crystallin family protein [Oscillospiraceae bacterium]
MFGITPYRRANDLFADPFRAMNALERNFFTHDQPSFRIDIEDEGNALLLSADLPGFEKEDIHIDLENDRLTICAERRSESEQKEKNYLRCERTYGSYRRSFGLDGIDAENISASYRNGVLKLTLPKLTATQPETRRIEIQ